MLRIKELQVAYGNICAVKGLNLEVHQGELVCLIGSNGAGKSTTLKAIAGLIIPTHGEIHLQAWRIWGRPEELLARGLALVPEGRGVFAGMTVLENLQMGAYLRVDDIKEDLEQIFEYFPRLKERLHQLAGTLSGGEQQMVAMARAIMGKPSLLLLDEPSMGLSPMMVETVFQVIEQIAKQGMTILLVEQNAQRALSIADRAYVMESGLITIAGTGEELLHDPRISKAYLGE
jgi:branched-chain amino acid transport system ATP-binding protein